MPKNGNYFLFFSYYKVFITCFFYDQYSQTFKKIVEKNRVIKGIYGTDIQTSYKEKIVQQLRISYSFIFPFFKKGKIEFCSIFHIRLYVEFQIAYLFNVCF